MLYIIAFTLVFFLVFGFLKYNKKQKKANKLIEIREKWGKSISKIQNFKIISQYYNALIITPDSRLSDEIAADIDLEKVFMEIDRTNSKPGQQYLYAHLRTTKPDICLLHELDSLAEQFKTDDELRIQLEFHLQKLAHRNAYYIHELFTTTYATLYHKGLALYIKYAGILWVLMLSFTVLSKNQYLFLFTLGLTLVNFYLHFTNKQKIAKYVHSLPQLYNLIQVVKKCVTLTKSHNEIVNSLEHLKPLQKTLSYINFQDDSKNNDPSDISSSIFELIKILLLIEPAMFLISINRIHQQQDNIKALFNYVGKIDVAISILSLRTGLPYYCKPNFNIVDQELIVEDVYHPNIINCVANSIKVNIHQGILITGSNMSGKTTFIRSILINTLLAQTLFTSLSRSYTAPFLQLFTSIRINDNLEEQQSYFQAEAISVLNILKKSTVPQNSLIIIDEIFRGTNTIERIAAAKAILSYLIENKNFVFVSTHDLELAELLGKEYCSYSFEEKVSNERLIFDYKIKPGILKNKNGIAILAALGYPSTVVENANTISKTLKAKYNI